MNINRLSWINIIRNPFNTILSLLLMSFGIGIISLLLLLNKSVEDKLRVNLNGIDMVIGAKGSPLQLILSSIYHIDTPTGNILLEEVNKIKSNPMIESTIPLSFGDSYKGFRIVGTTHAYPKLFKVNFNVGKLWHKSMQVVVGSDVAEACQLKIGSAFYSSHGLLEGGEIHNKYAFKVVGILDKSNTIIDQLILTNSESINKVHNHKKHSNHTHEGVEGDCSDDHSEMITAMLVKFRSPVGFIKFPRQVNETTNLQAAVPAFEINRLISLLGLGVRSINMIAFFIIIVSGLSIFISLYNSLKRRRYELALMRVHGATRFQLVKLVFQEGMLISILGLFLGILFSRLILYVVSFFIHHNYSFYSIQLSLIKEELWLFPIALFVGLIASLIPIIQAYRINIPKTLSNV
jgi:putative ABC transport system permease protein